MLQRPIDIQPTQYRAWDCWRAYLNQHADAKWSRTPLKAIDLSADLRKRTPRFVSPADAGSYYAAVGKEAAGRAAALGRPQRSSPDAPKCSTRWRSGTKRSTIVTKRCDVLQRLERLAMLRERLRAIRNLPRFAPTRGMARASAPSASVSEGDESLVYSVNACVVRDCVSTTGVRRADLRGRQSERRSLGSAAAAQEEEGA